MAMRKIPRLLFLIVAQPQRIGTRIRRFLRYIARFGAVSGLKALTRVLAGSGPILSIKIPQSRTTVLLRANTSDIPVFEQVFLWDDYELPVAIEPRFIIDGGANVGYASVYFANKYPEAQIVAIEPEASNFEMLVRNTAGYSKVSPVRAAIWNESGDLEIENDADASWSFRVRKSESGEGVIKALTISDIINLFKAESVDILKLDIEGAEKEVFSSNLGWLDKVRMVIVELHDQYKPGCSASLYPATAGQGFKEFCRGENVFLFREGA